MSNDALARQAAKLEKELGGVAPAVRRLVELQATDDEIRAIYYPRLTAFDRRGLDRLIAEHREAWWPRAVGETRGDLRSAVDKYRAKTGRPPKDWTEKDDADFEDFVGAGEDQPPSLRVLPDKDWDAIVAAFWRWHDREGNAGRKMPLEEMVQEADVGRDRLRDVLRRHDVDDYRYLAEDLRKIGRPSRNQ